jgi:hypothetical protein
VLNSAKSGEIKMDFLIFLLVAGTMFYFSKMQPELKKQKIQTESSSTTMAIPLKVNPRTRPTVPPLYGIEISASQQRRLGKNDPSVIAANLIKPENRSSWLNEIKNSLFDGAKHHPELNNFFDQLFGSKK